MEPKPLASVTAATQPSMEPFHRIDRHDAASPSPAKQPLSTRPLWMCLALAVFPGIVMALAAPPRWFGLLRVAIFTVVTTIYVTGIVAFTVSSTLDNSVLLTHKGDPFTNTASVVFIAWGMNIGGPLVTMAVDFGMWLRWQMICFVDDEGYGRHCIGNGDSSSLISVHLLCLLVLAVIMTIQSTKVKAASWRHSCCWVWCCGCCCPYIWLGSALAAANKEKIQHDELPAYDAC